MIFNNIQSFGDLNCIQLEDLTTGLSYDLENTSSILDTATIFIEVFGNVCFFKLWLRTKIFSNPSFSASAIRASILAIGRTSPLKPTSAAKQ